MKFLFSSSLFKIFILFIILTTTATILIYNWISRSNIEVAIARGQRIVFLITVQKEIDAPNDLALIAHLEPTTGKIGLIGLYPKTILSETKKPIAQMERTEIRDAIDSNFPFEIDYEIFLTYKDLIRIIDLMEGVPTFFWEDNLLPNENFPSGDFILDGSQVINYLNISKESENLPAFRLFRYYSFILNIWLNKSSKWKNIKSPKIFSKAIENINTDLGANDMLSLAKELVQPEWQIFTMEIPITRLKDKFLIDHEVTRIYLKDLEKKLKSQKDISSQKPPKLEIRNGTKTHNLARKYGRKLTREGIIVLEFSNADRHDYKKSVLLNTGGSVAYANTVARILGIDLVYSAINKSRFTDLILILGEDHKTLKWGRK